LTILYAAFLLGILIFVHELGHFLFAKLLGVKVLKFSLGFGPKLAGKTVGETEYCISAFPLGGYVKMLGEEPGEELPQTEKERAFSNQPVWKRFSIVFFGPIFNLIFAAVVFIAIFMAGVPVLHPDVGNISKNSPAETGGLRTGDRITEINGHRVRSWDEVETQVEGSNGALLNLKVERNGQVVSVRVIPERKAVRNVFGEKKEAWEIGASPLIYPVVGGVLKGSPAEKAGLRKDDRIYAIQGIRIRTWQDMTEVIHGSPGEPLKFTIKRGDNLIKRTITPEKNTITVPGGGEKEVGLIGIRPLENTFIKRFGPVSALSLGLGKTWEISVLTVESIIKLIQKVIPAKTIGGPIMIFEMAGQTASRGAIDFFTFMAVISINLGVLNLLPIPILDGGHLLFIGIEAVRKRPVSEKVVMLAQKVGLALLISLMAFAFYNDILKLIAGTMFPK
jgi:regulator of sigma E protease